MTRRENLRRVLHGQEPAWVPFALNFAQWHIHHKRFGTLPSELSDCADYIEAMKALGCDIFTRNIDGGCRVIDTILKPKVTEEPAETGPRTTTVYSTPYGELRHVNQQQTKLSCSHDEEYMVKDWERDGKAFRYFLDQRRVYWDEQTFIATNASIGDWGIVNVPFMQTPLKFLHLYFGLEYSCFFFNDYPAAARELAEVFWAKVRPQIKRLAEHPHVESVILMDNVDAPFYPPVMAEVLWEPYVHEAAELMRTHGKLLFVHACGKLAALSKIFARSGVSGLEGIAHPPLGDWPPGEAQKCHERFIFIGGFSGREQMLMDSDDALRAFYARFLPSIDRSRFIFSSSCNTATGTSWERIKLVRDIVQQWGGSPQ